jgi:ATPase family associated with various cellular activities (AAA)/ABC toxin N-terminal region
MARHEFESAIESIRLQKMWCSPEAAGIVYSIHMPKKGNQKPGKLRRKTNAEWNWRKNYRVWDANRKIFLYPENWIEPELRLPSRFRVPLSELALFIRPRCGAKGVRILFTGNNQPRRLVAAQALARTLGKDLYRIDLSAVVSKYIGETEKNLGRVFNTTKNSQAVLFFDEADALFGKRTDVKDSHDRYANIEINYLLRRSEKYAGLTILAARTRTRIDKRLLRRFHFIIPVPQRKKLRRKESSTC